jgi:hypothetical protein
MRLLLVGQTLALRRCPLNTTNCRFRLAAESGRDEYRDAFWPFDPGQKATSFEGGSFAVELATSYHEAQAPALPSPAGGEGSARPTRVFAITTA